MRIATGAGAVLLSMLLPRTGAADLDPRVPSDQDAPWQSTSIVVQMRSLEQERDRLRSQIKILEAALEFAQLDAKLSAQAKPLRETLERLRSNLADVENRLYTAREKVARVMEPHPDWTKAGLLLQLHQRLRQAWDRLSAVPLPSDARSQARQEAAKLAITLEVELGDLQCWKGDLFSPRDVAVQGKHVDAVIRRVDKFILDAQVPSKDLGADDNARRIKNLTQPSDGEPLLPCGPDIPLDLWKKTGMQAWADPAAFVCFAGETVPVRIRVLGGKPAYALLGTKAGQGMGSKSIVDFEIQYSTQAAGNESQEFVVTDSEGKTVSVKIEARIKRREETSEPLIDLTDRPDPPQNSTDLKELLIEVGGSTIHKSEETIELAVGGLRSLDLQGAVGNKWFSLYDPTDRLIIHVEKVRVRGPGAELVLRPVNKMDHLFPVKAGKCQYTLIWEVAGKPYTVSFWVIMKPTDAALKDIQEKWKDVNSERPLFPIYNSYALLVEDCLTAGDPAGAAKALSQATALGEKDRISFYQVLNPWSLYALAPFLGADDALAHLRTMANHGSKRDTMRVYAEILMSLKGDRKGAVEAWAQYRKTDPQAPEFPDSWRE